MSPRFTVSPALTLRVTVPLAGANSVGLTAATTRPLTAASRTSVPRVTAAMRSREALTDCVVSFQDQASTPTAPSAATATLADATARNRRRRGLCVTAMSWPEVSGIMGTALQGACQRVISTNSTA